MANRKKGVTDNIPEGALKIIKDEKIKVGFALHSDDQVVKYEKKTFLRVYRGYDFLQNLITVKYYVQRKYNIKQYDLEILLYLYPVNYFTQSDFLFIPR